MGAENTRQKGYMNEEEEEQFSLEGLQAVPEFSPSMLAEEDSPLGTPELISQSSLLSGESDKLMKKKSKKKGQIVK